ncbi:hypothetical protein NL676_038150 [Syzygium grande]|nr:hypothetical protein NL676_038150 [Syzygium grande]
MKRFAAGLFRYAQPAHLHKVALNPNEQKPTEKLDYLSTSKTYFAPLLGSFDYLTPTPPDLIPQLEHLRTPDSTKKKKNALESRGRRRTRPNENDNRASQVRRRRNGTRRQIDWRSRSTRRLVRRRSDPDVEETWENLRRDCSAYIGSLQKRRWPRLPSETLIAPAPPENAVVCSGSLSDLESPEQRRF